MGGGNRVTEEERAEWVSRFSIHKRPRAPRDVRRRAAEHVSMGEIRDRG